MWRSRRGQRPSHFINGLDRSLMTFQSVFSTRLSAQKTVLSSQTETPPSFYRHRLVVVNVESFHFESKSQHELSAYSDSQKSFAEELPSEF